MSYHTTITRACVSSKNGHIRWIVLAMGFAIPIAVMLSLRGDGQWSDSAVWWVAVGAQLPGVLAERWLFFAQARHPQNLYYQVVS